MNPESSEFRKFIEEQKQKDINYLVWTVGVPYEDSEDIYQEACIALYENLKNNKVYEGAALSTYLMRICLNKSGHYFEKKKQMQPDENSDEILLRIPQLENEFEHGYSDEKINEILSVIEEGEEKGYIDRLIDKVQGIVSDMPDPCDKLLWMKYWDKLSHKVMAQIMKYKSADVSKTKTSRCLSRFKQRIYELI